MVGMLLSATSNIFMTIVIVVAVFFGIFAFVSLATEIWKLVLVSRYTKYNKQEIKAGLTGSEVARKMLDGLGLNDVEVVQCNFFSAMFLGNSYSPFKKRIRLRKNIFNQKSLTAVAVASQKVALAQRDYEGDKKIKVRTAFMYIGYFAPFTVLPLVLVGLLIDFLLIGNGILTIVFSALAFAYYIASFIVLCLNIPIEKRACNTSLEFIKKVNLLTEEEQNDARILYKTYIISYVLDFISALLYIIWRIVKFIGKILTFAIKKK